MLGRPVAAIVRDGASDPGTFAREAERLLEDDGAAAIFGCWTSASRCRGLDGPFASTAETARAIVERLRQAGDGLDHSAGSLQRSVQRFRLPTP